MFNIYQQDKKQALEKAKSMQILKEAKWKEKTRQTSTKLHENYENRVRNFIHDMLLNPITVNNPSRREPRGFKGSSTMVINQFKRQKDRIRHTMQQTKLLDTSPSSPVLDFRPRYKSKEIHPNLSLNSLNSSSQIKQNQSMIKTFKRKKTETIPEIPKKTLFNGIKTLLLLPKKTPEVHKESSKMSISSSHHISESVMARQALERCKYIMPIIPFKKKRG